MKCVYVVMSVKCTLLFEFWWSVCMTLWCRLNDVIYVSTHDVHVIFDTRNSFYDEYDVCMTVDRSIRTLWRVHSYFFPGFPRPTISHGFGGGAGFFSSTASCSGARGEEVDIDAVKEEVIDAKICKLQGFKDRQGKEMGVLGVRKQWRQIGKRRAATEDREAPILISGGAFLEWFEKGEELERSEVKKIQQWQDKRLWFWFDWEIEDWREEPKLI